MESTRYFYPRSPCGERRRNGQNIKRRHKFLSTLSLRRATPPYNLMIHHAKNFYPRSPCGERLPRLWRSIPGPKYFYPRSPCGERRRNLLRCEAFLHFYPRSPCGERPAKNTSIAGRITSFLSTLSLRRATAGTMGKSNRAIISIHALLAESDIRGAAPPRPPKISIHALLAESDGIGLVFLWWGVRISIHALLAESDIGTLRTVSVRKTFLSTLSLRRATSLVCYMILQH